MLRQSVVCCRPMVRPLTRHACACAGQSCASAAGPYEWSSYSTILYLFRKVARPPSSKTSIVSATYVLQKAHRVRDDQKRNVRRNTAFDALLALQSSTLADSDHLCHVPLTWRLNRLRSSQEGASVNVGGTWELRVKIGLTIPERPNLEGENLDFVRVS
jgi:hypothetical protein